MNDLTIKLGLDDSGLPPPVQRVNAVIGSIGKGAEISARQTAAAFRILPAQFTDIATQLAGGQNPLLILLQQGGQIKDSFGGIGPAISAVSTFITPTAIAVGALAVATGGFALAATLGSAQTKELRNNIELTGNAAGLTGARLQATAQQVAAATQQTVGGARDIVQQLASSGQVSNKVLESMATAVGRVADVTGEDAKKITTDFAGMAGGVAKWAAEHNKAWNFITAEQYKYIKRLEEQGKAEQAMVYVNEQVTKHLANQQRNLGLLESSWDTVRKAASGAWDAMLGVGRETSTRQQLDIAIDRLSALGGNLTPKAREAAEQKIQLLKEQLKLENQGADARSSNAAKERAAIAAIRADEGKAKQRDREKPYIPGEFQVLDARDGQILAARREKAESERESFFQKELSNQADRDARRMAQEQDFLTGLLDANARASVALIDDERTRGEAEISLAKSIAMRQLDVRRDLLRAIGLLDPGRDAREQAAIEEAALIARRKLEVDLRKSSDKVGDDAGKATYEGVHGAISAAFRDSDNPIKAFGAALANTIFTRATQSLIDALATAAVGKDGKGGGLGDLISLVGSVIGGGYSVDAGGIGTNFTGDSLPTRGGMATGTNYVPRNMLLLAHQGEAIVPKQYNPAAGGMGGGGLVINSSPQVRIDARSDEKQVARLVFSAISEANTALIEDLQARGLIVS